MLKTILHLALLPVAFGASGAFAAWTLKSNESSLNFVSIKKDTVGEVHSFKQLDGKIEENGDFQFSINLGGVETNIPVRNDRMNEFLFETTKFPLASGKGKVDMTVVNAMAVGQVQTMKVPVQIELHGKSVLKEVVFQAAKLSPDKLWVVTAVPFLIDAAEFDLTAGVDKLRELVLLPNIAQAVPVTASLMFVPLDKSASGDKKAGKP